MLGDLPRGGVAGHETPHSDEAGGAGVRAHEGARAPPQGRISRYMDDQQRSEIQSGTAMPSIHRSLTPAAFEHRASTAPDCRPEVRILMPTAPETDPWIEVYAGVVRAIIERERRRSSGAPAA
jgi:hypothetical protein